MGPITHSHYHFRHRKTPGRTGCRPLSRVSSACSARHSWCLWKPRSSPTQVLSGSGSEIFHTPTQVLPLLPSASLSQSPSTSQVRLTPRHCQCLIGSFLCVPTMSQCSPPTSAKPAGEWWPGHAESGSHQLERERRPSTERSHTKTKLTRLDGWWVKQKQEPRPVAA